MKMHRMGMEGGNEYDYRFSGQGEMKEKFKFK